MRNQWGVMAMLSIAYLSLTRSATFRTPVQPLIQPASNLTIISDVNIDPRLQILARYGDTDLPRTSCLMNAVDLLATLARMDYNGRIPETKSSTPGYANVIIEIRPHQPAKFLATRLAVLGVYFSIWRMMTDNIFKFATFAIHYDGKPVGFVWILPLMAVNQNQVQNLAGAPLGAKLLDLNGTSSNTLSRSAIDKDVTNANTANAINADFELVMSFYPQGTPLSSNAVFITVLGTLKHIAMYDVSKTATPFEISVHAFNCLIRWEIAANSGLTGPPSFEYKWILEAAKQIPVWMLTHRFAESFFTMVVNGYVVGQGSIFSGTRPGLGKEEGNVTSS